MSSGWPPEEDDHRREPVRHASVVGAGHDSRGAERGYSGYARYTPDADNSGEFGPYDLPPSYDEDGWYTPAGAPGPQDASHPSGPLPGTHGGYGGTSGTDLYGAPVYTDAGYGEAGHGPAQPGAAPYAAGSYGPGQYDGASSTATSTTAPGTRATGTTARATRPGRTRTTPTGRTNRTASTRARPPDTSPAATKGTHRRPGAGRLRHGPSAGRLRVRFRAGQLPGLPRSRRPGRGLPGDGLPAGGLPRRPDGRDIRPPHRTRTVRASTVRASRVRARRSPAPRRPRRTTATRTTAIRGMTTPATAISPTTTLLTPPPATAARPRPRRPTRTLATRIAGYAHEQHGSGGYPGVAALDEGYDSGAYPAVGSPGYACDEYDAYPTPAPASRAPPPARDTHRTTPATSRATWPPSTCPASTRLQSARSVTWPPGCPTRPRPACSTPPASWTAAGSRTARICTTTTRARPRPATASWTLPPRSGRWT